MSRTYLVLLAGGVGSRVGAPVPKQFVDVLGKPVIAYTLEAFQNHPEIDAIEVVCVAGYEEVLGRICRDHGISKIFRTVAGGVDYQHSVMNGVRGLADVAQPDDVVMIHWAASPFVSDEIISDSIRVCREHGNAISSCPAFLLYGTNDGDCARDVIDRDTFMTMNAPQSFLFRNAMELHDKAERTGLIDQVEPHTTTLMARLGMPIYFSKGDQVNIKITTARDLDLFEGFVLMKQNRSKNHQD